MCIFIWFHLYKFSSVDPQTKRIDFVAILNGKIWFKIVHGQANQDNE